MFMQNKSNMNIVNPQSKRISKKRLHQSKSGLLPGTAIYTGDKHPENISISRLD